MDNDVGRRLTNAVRGHILEIDIWNKDKLDIGERSSAMTTLENTISMMENLPETDLVKIQDFIRGLFRQHESDPVDITVGKALRRMSKRDFIEDVKAGESDIADGRYTEASEVFDGLEKRYGF